MGNKNKRVRHSCARVHADDHGDGTVACIGLDDAAAIGPWDFGQQIGSWPSLIRLLG